SRLPAVSARRLVNPANRGRTSYVARACARLARAQPTLLDQTFFNKSFHRFHASARAFLSASRLLFGSSPERMNPWPAPSSITSSYVFFASFIIAVTFDIDELMRLSFSP